MPPRASRMATNDQYLSRTRQAELDALAQAVVDEQRAVLPIEPTRIARANGLTISFNDYGTGAFDGLLEHRAGRFHIYCNTKRCGAPSETRSRFTLGHELGHY